MTLHLVIDATTRPAAFGRAAARAARRLGAHFLHEAAVFDLAAHPDAVQYVYAAGGLGPSGLFFAERLLDTPIEPACDAARILEAATAGEVVVPIHPAFGQDAAALRTGAALAGIPLAEIVADPHRDEPQALADSAGDPSVTIALVGRERDHRDVYPAAMVSLLDAAALLDLPLRILFVPPGRVEPSVLAGADGILLPGGSEMGNVPGQIDAARYALAERVPVLGLCLGMQTMTTAFAQQALRDGRINLAEADPEAATWSFVPMAAEGAGLPEHRTGDATLTVTPGTRFDGMLGAGDARMRCNHRYCLAPGLRRPLEAAGLVASATSFAGRVVDAVEWPSHPFFVGVQGHPELGAPAGKPHPVFPAFLAAARGDNARKAGRPLAKW
ncbi:CTP synthase [Methylobacterium terricola]|uniref:CTP synthase (glutamine hydrolyzing) n=1 Tax=Methylobacterium terricola TaxID=2583531 RepID=A0A5C4L675_9HYPH|nr:gamma-glutamyl-gamma-aminobutyrate hydrolase family protein [Methylobacterium terricola]TNC06197.1 CTP synthase [Methylobacterium terricola]